MEYFHDKVNDLRKSQRQKNNQMTDPRTDYKERMRALNQLKKLLLEHEDSWLKALEEDLSKAPAEAYASEIALLLNEIDLMKKNLKKWMKKKTSRRLLMTGFETVEITRKPYGSMLVIAPWNFPLQLALLPVIGALAAGNSVVLKPSEHAPATSHLLNELIPLYLDGATLKVIEGDGRVAQHLTAMDWDFIFFTGSVSTGQKVYEAAARNLTHVLLQLGGKNPCILDDSPLSDETIEKIIWGKFSNAGQACIAPDTVYIDRSRYAEFLEKAEKQIETFYGKDPVNSPHYGRIIHGGQYEHLIELLDGGRIASGGYFNREELYISPTLLVDIEKDSRLTKEEIFGPLLPVVPYDSLDEVITRLQNAPTPIATYVFSERPALAKRLGRELESNSVVYNQVLLQATSPNFPFGGKGQSGIGNYHGEASFKSLTYEKAAYRKRDFASNAQAYPPYKEETLSLLRRFRKYIF